MQIKNTSLPITPISRLNQIVDPPRHIVSHITVTKETLAAINNVGVEYNFPFSTELITYNAFKTGAVYRVRVSETNESF